MNIGKALLALGLMQTIATGGWKLQPTEFHRDGEERFLANYYLKLYSGYVNGAAIPAGGIDPVPGQEYVVSAPTGTAAPINCVLIATEGARITVTQGSKFKVGSFPDGTDTVQYLDLMCGSLNYEYTVKIDRKLGTGRKYIVRTKGRAIGAFGTKYSLALNISCSEATVTVQEGQIGLVNIKGVLSPDYDHPFKIVYAGGYFTFQEPPLEDIGGGWTP